MSLNGFELWKPYKNKEMFEGDNWARHGYVRLDQLVNREGIDAKQIWEELKKKEYIDDEGIIQKKFVEELKADFNIGFSSEVNDKIYEALHRCSYFPWQGDIVKLESTKDGSYDLCISSCCDIYRRYKDDKIDYVSFLEVIPLPLHIRYRYIDYENGKTHENPVDGFTTVREPVTLQNINDSEFKTFVGTPSNLQHLLSICSNDILRYVFIPHQPGYFEVDVIVDLQSIKTAEISKKEGGDCFSMGSRLIRPYARLDYRYRDYMLQRFSSYMARIALPDCYVGKPSKDEYRFFEHIRSRLVDWVPR